MTDLGQYITQNGDGFYQWRDETGDLSREFFTYYDCERSLAKYIDYMNGETQLELQS